MRKGKNIEPLDETMESIGLGGLVESSSGGEDSNRSSSFQDDEDMNRRRSQEPKRSNRNGRSRKRQSGLSERSKDKIDRWLSDVENLVEELDTPSRERDRRSGGREGRSRERTRKSSRNGRSRRERNRQMTRGQANEEILEHVRKICREATREVTGRDLDYFEELEDLVYDALESRRADDKTVEMIVDTALDLVERVSDDEPRREKDRREKSRQTESRRRRRRRRR